MRIANTGKEIASCRQVSSDSHHRTKRGGGFGSVFIASASLLLSALAALAASSCDPITGTGPGTPPDPKQYLKVDAGTKSAVVTLIAGSAAFLLSLMLRDLKLPEGIKLNP